MALLFLLVCRRVIIATIPVVFVGPTFSREPIVKTSWIQPAKSDIETLA